MGLAIRVFTGVVLSCLIVSSSSAQLPPAGTAIVNQAGASYTDGASPSQSLSNTVTNTVLPVYAIILTPPGSVASPAYSLAGVGGDTLYCAFDLTNAGNDRDSVAVSHAVIPPSNTTISDLIFFYDANGNGRFDPGEDDPAFLAIDAGNTARMDAGVVLPTGAFGGDAFVEVRAVSTADTTDAVQTSVIRVTNTGPPAMTLHLGPSGNARAAPGGEGSSDDLTVGYTDYTSTSYTFTNDVLNDDSAPDFFEIALNDTVGLPPQIRVEFADSVGQRLPQSPADSDVYQIGMMAAGEVRPLQVIVSSTAGPLASVLGQPLSLRVRARSIADTLQQNHTVDRLVPPQQINPAATLAIDQAFHQQSATLGDVVTLLVTTRNITDSVRVDSVVVYEWAQPQLEFVSSSDFAWEDGRLVWRAGSLAGGESKTAVIKYVANSRVNHGTARASGNVAGVAQSGDDVWAGPAVSTVRIENAPLFDQAVVLGEVYVDENDNRRRDAGEQGVPEVAIYLDSGEYAVTDSLGKFSLPMAFDGWRAIRMDEGTIPPDLEFFVPPTSRDAGRRENETLIHLLPGGNAKVSFRLKRIPPPTVEVDHALTYHEQVSVARYARLYKAFVVPSAYFALAKARLTIDAAEQLRPVVEFLHEHRDWGVFLEGHTDSIPISNEEFPSNIELSLSRAEAIRLHLVAMGVEHDRIVVAGYGDTRPLATNETIEGRRLNRRVEVSMIPPGVRLEDGELRRVSATIKDLSVLPDTFKVHVRWEFSTTSERPCDAKLRVELPYQLQSADVRVSMDDETIVPTDGTYALRGFARSRAARCEIELKAANGDTSYVKNIRALVEIDDPQAEEAPQLAGDVLTAPPASSAPLATPRKQFTIRPYDNRRVGTAQAVELMSWSETVPKQQTTSAGETEIARATDATSGAEDDAADDEATGSFAILGPRDGEVFSRSDQIKIRARVPLGARADVFVGGEQLPDGHIGHKAIHVKDGFEEITWFAVRIYPGWNTVTVRSQAVNGAVDTDSVSVALAARPALVESQRKRVLIPADGKTSDLVRFEVRDERGLPVADGFVATVVEGDSLVANADARPDVPGLQVSSHQGYFELKIKPDNRTRRRTVAVECNGMRDRCDVAYVSAARPMMATGVVDFRFGSYETGGDGSKEGLDRVAGASEDGASADAQARLFAQSALPYGAALTVRVDTEERDEEPLLKQINPQMQYPIYGDASELRVATPTKTGNYVSVDKGESFLRYGDFRTPFTGGQYLNYHQVATGVTGSLVGDDGAVRGFVTDTDYATYRDEFKSDGTSGFYYLTQAPFLENTERLFLETRQRYQEEIILELKPLVRNRDYLVNPFDGSILFQEPVPITDRYFNPIYIVAIYEARTDDESQYLFGLRGDLVRDRRYTVGGTAITNSGDGSGYALYGADGRVDVRGVTVGGEFARSEDDVLGEGNAYVVEAGVNNRITDTKLYYRRVDQDFTNPSFLGGAQEIGTRKVGLKSRLWMGGGGLSLLADGYAHDLRRSGEEYSSVLAGADFRHPLFELFAGARAAKDVLAEGDLTSYLSVVKLTVDAPRRIEVRGWWEQILGGDVTRDYPNRLATLLAIPFGQRLRVTTSYEYLSGSGRPGTNQFQAGIESRLAPRTTAYTRYAMSRTASAERMGALAGLRQAFRFRRNVTGTLALEAYQSMVDDGEDEYLAVKTGIATRRANDYVLEGRYEYRWQQTRRKHLFQLAASAQLRSGFSLLLSDAVSFTPDLVREDGLHYRGKLGLAYRPIGVPLQSLFALKNFYERYTPVDPDGISWRLVLSADVNVLPALQHEVRLKYAYKRTENYSYGISVNTDADLVLGQYVYRFARVWDVDLWGRVLAVRHGTTESGVGVELGRLFFRTVRVAAGYSAGGFEDPDISGTDAWARGWGVRIQLMLSDWITNEFSR
jgi:flagellar motor protein MotB